MKPSPYEKQLCYASLDNLAHWHIFLLLSFGRLLHNNSTMTFDNYLSTFDNAYLRQPLFECALERQYCDFFHMKTP